MCSRGCCGRPSWTWTCSRRPSRSSPWATGRWGCRGTGAGGEPHGLPGTYLNGGYESRPLPYAEAGYGYPESGQTVINITNGKVIRLLRDAQPIDGPHG